MLQKLVNKPSSSLAKRRVLTRKRTRIYTRAQRFRRNTSTYQTISRYSPSTLVGGLAAFVGVTSLYLLLNQENSAEADSRKSSNVDYNEVKKEIRKIMESNPKYDDGSYGPVLVRLAWHASGTYSKKDGSGGSNGSTMRYDSEAKHAANAGLELARNLLEPLKKKFPGITYADLWTLAGCIAVEEMGGPKVPWRPGRSDYTDEKKCPPDGRLPDASKTESHIRDIFYRMGFNDQEIVALIGAHVLGRAHKNRSGYDGPWTNSPTTFSNDFFVQLLERKWKKKNWKGPEQFEDESGSLMMLPADLAFIKDSQFKKYVEIYAQDEEKFFNDFSKAFCKLLELGVPFPKDSKYIN